jgi:hypothetical protein
MSSLPGLPNFGLALPPFSVTNTLSHSRRSVPLATIGTSKGSFWVDVYPASAMAIQTAVSLALASVW